MRAIVKTALLTCKTFPGARLLAVDLPTQEELERVIGCPHLKFQHLLPVSLHSAHMILYSWSCGLGKYWGV